jgi:hypothetical protein
LLVITGDIDAALTKALPRLLGEVRGLVGERRVTIVFDRGGWSPRLFATMIKDGFDLLTYRKGRCRRINERRFIRPLEAPRASSFLRNHCRASARRSRRAATSRRPPVAPVHCRRLDRKHRQPLPEVGSSTA